MIYDMRWCLRWHYVPKTTWKVFWL